MPLRIMPFVVSKRSKTGQKQRILPRERQDALLCFAIADCVAYSAFFNLSISFWRSNTIEDSLSSEISAIGKVELI
ncbi:hypothetical protein SAMN05444128_0694 [Pontibacter indicus]|uniref:Uncharacterized protein n=1 Tax=Pontibacter indicus TaxID=1317125 RepID=A0A1R3WLH6_9BACT|nr:hypothetical protein SAMN05444128_0694 [Pontibacter indicus]